MSCEVAALPLQAHANFKTWSIAFEMKNDLKGRIDVMERFRDCFTLGLFDQIATLTYVLINNFCPCLHLRIRNSIMRSVVDKFCYLSL